MATGFSVTAGAALAAATAKTAVNIVTGASKIPTLVAFDVSFDGTSSTAVPVAIDICSSTQGVAGTSTAFTPLLLRGDPSETAQFTAGINYTAEPTTLVVLKSYYISPTAGFVYQFPLGREIIGLITAATARKGICIRLTAPAIVNYKVNVEVEE